MARPFADSEQPEMADFYNKALYGDVSALQEFAYLSLSINIRKYEAEITQLIAMSLNAERLDFLCTAVKHLDDQASNELSASSFRAEYEAALLFTAHYSAREYSPSALYDQLIPDVIAWVSFFSSNPAWLDEQYQRCSACWRIY
ncbi:hypothetical protein CYLTODRAFT_259053 [Cylindrobasidium torrendii FP15055 ss-10]|uniref:Uncharacterized protein n=1 Tax=Cylindrobasidium torrendii FP15055 ss-10 TaxID=1314674 RepID=A0A0D7BEH4_9AGAR|nr:hypothetical protein CYLTODRAFT_259053 [Cylindrobasidium torrendii FP15055 ss-10]